MPDENDNVMETSFGSHSLELNEREQLRAANAQLRKRKERSRLVLKDDLTRKFDHILYTQWDPMGVHFLEEYDCFDEYQAYLPTLVDMVRAGASLSDLSDQLMLLESYMKGDEHIRRRCDVIAVMLTSYGPHHLTAPFKAIVNIDTPENAYQSVLDLVTQTRLDAYEKKWEEVRIGYEKAIPICQTCLPERDALIGTCLNNLGHAHSELGQLEDAQEQFEKALTKLKFEGPSDEPLYLLCLNNLIINLEHRRAFSDAAPYLHALISYYEQTVGVDNERTSYARVRLDKLTMSDRAPVNLVCTRISVEQDGCGGIQNFIVIE